MSQSSDGRQQHRAELAVPRFAQPDDVTCGPTCLLSVLRYYGNEISFARLAELTPTNPDGGTLAVYLGHAARRLGYAARLYPFSPQICDPTWRGLGPEALRDKLRQRAAAVAKPKLRDACRAYADFLDLGGEVALRDPSVALLVEALERGHPILCGLSGTYLYEQPRERPDDNVEDDVAGDPVGHFLVVCGHDGPSRFSVRDPATHVPEPFADGHYEVDGRRLLNAILLGVVSYDAVLLEVWPEELP